MRVRDAELSDAAAIQAIYAPYVTDSCISFEDVAPDTPEIVSRMTATMPNYPYLVADDGGEVVGYAYASRHRLRSAYRASIDTAIYVHPAAHRSGVGRALLSHLLVDARRRGYHAAFAGIALPNESSVGLHEAMGFTPVGVYREVGFKFGQWHDVGWWQRLL